MGYAHGHRWTDEEIEKRVLEAVKALQLNRMPSRSELENYYGNCALTNKISKTIGYYKLAEKLKLRIKESETAFGKKYETIAANTLREMGFDIIQMPQNFPYDLLANGSVKIDIKASKLYKGTNGNFFSFNLEKPYATCDIYVLYLCNEDSSLAGTLIIPSKFVVTNNQISVGQYKSIYKKYADRWDYVERYVKLHECFVR